MIRLGFTHWYIDAFREPYVKNSAYDRVGYVAYPAFLNYRLTFNTSTALRNFLKGNISLNECLQEVPREHTVGIEMPSIEAFELVDRADWNLDIKALVRRLGVLRSRFADDIIMTLRRLRLARWDYNSEQGYKALIVNECAKAAQGTLTYGETNKDEIIEIRDVDAIPTMPEFVAVDLVKDVVTEKEFAEFAQYNHITIMGKEHIYRVYRKVHATIDVWDLQGSPIAKLCVIFISPGMPPSDELIMKYVLAKQAPDILWKIGNKLGTPGQFHGEYCNAT